MTSDGFSKNFSLKADNQITAIIVYYRGEGERDAS